MTWVGAIFATIWALSLFCAYVMGRIDEHLRRQPKGEILEFTRKR